MRLSQKRLRIISHVLLPKLQAEIDNGPDGSDMMEAVKEEGEFTEEDVQGALDALWELVQSKQRPVDG